MAFRREDRIASGNGKGGMPLSIYYIGGSSFVLVKDGEEDHPIAKMTLQQVKKIIAAKKVTLLCPKHLEEIENEVDPDTGDTASHNADGSVKSTVDQMLNKYQQDGYIVDDGNGGVKSIDEGAVPQPRRRRRHRTSGDGDSSSHDSSTGQQESQNRNGGVPLNADESQEQPGNGNASLEKIDDVDPFADIDTGRYDEPDRPQRNRRQLSDYDDAPEPDMERSKPRSQRTANPEEDQGHIGGPLFVFIVVTILLCLVLFFGSFIVSSKIFHGKRDEMTSGQTTSQKKDSKNSNKGKGDSGKKENTNSEPTTASGLDPIKRTDFDPEDAVKTYTMASSSEKAIADGFMKQVRSLIANGDVDSFTQMVALDNVSSEIAISYADLSQVRQNLTDDEKAELLQYYKNTLMQQERKHITDKDLYASMFGGRVREVRQQAGKLYVVMESIGGDHQRACFVLTEDAQSGSWALTDIVDTNGYVKMIGSGDTSQYVQDLKKDAKSE